MLNDIYALTAAPELAAETELALRSATRSVHMSASFPRDLATALIKVSTPAYLTALDAPSLLPRLRGLSTVRLVDSAEVPMVHPHIECVELGDIYEPIYGTLKNDIAYVAGTQVNIRTSVAAAGFLVEYFQVPLVTPDVYNSWIAQLSPDVIVWLAASKVFATSGNEEKAKSYARTVETQLMPELISNFLTTSLR
jgi:hypothetical protein